MTPRAVIETLGMKPHPEGGWYVETFRDAPEGARGHSSAIYFLLERDQVSAWHRVRDAAQIVAGNTGRARRFGAAAIEHGVILSQQFRHRLVDTDIDAAIEGNALARHLLDAAVDEVLFDLEIRNAVAHQPAGPAFALIDMDFVPGAAKLLGGGHAGRAGADDGDALSRLVLRRIGPDIARLIGLVGQRVLDRLDGDRDILKVQRTRFLARRRADAAGELREIVGRMQVADRRIPVAPIDKIVPVRNLVVNGAARRPMAIGHAAVHAARRLFLHFLVRHRQRELVEMPDAVGSRLVLVYLPVDFEEARYLAHVTLPITLRPLPSAHYPAYTGLSLASRRAFTIPPPRPCASAPSRPVRGDIRPA